MKNFGYKVLGATALTLVLSVLPAFAVGNNGSFEMGTDPSSFTTLYPGDANITGWNVDSGSVDYIGTYWQASNGTRNVDLNGFATGSISQSVATIPGASYTVTFDLSGNPDSLSDVNDPYYSPSLKTVTVGATGATSANFNYDTAAMGNSLGDMKWVGQTYTFTATNSNTTLSFTSAISGAFGPAVDNIVITETVPAVAACPAGTVQTLVETDAVNSSSTTPTQTSALANGQSYLLVSSGTWQNSSLNTTDTAYASVDGWATAMNGYNINPYFLGSGEFDLMVNNAFVNWGAYDAGHTYSYLYTGTGAPANLMVFDGDSTVPNPTPNLGWYGDNSGSLAVAVYSCTVPVTTGTISGMKYNDLNRNGVKDAGEPGLQGWVIRLLRENNTLVTTATTDANGNYTFANVAPGTYKVRETHKLGWKRMSDNPEEIAIDAGSTVTNIDFGNAKIRKGEREDTDKDDNHDDRSGCYYTHHDKSNYTIDFHKNGHDQKVWSFGGNHFGNVFHH